MIDLILMIGYVIYDERSSLRLYYSVNIDLLHYLINIQIRISVVICDYINMCLILHHIDDMNVFMSNRLIAQTIFINVN